MALDFKEQRFINSLNSNDEILSAEVILGNDGFSISEIKANAEEIHINEIKEELNVGSVAESEQHTELDTNICSTDKPSSDAGDLDDVVNISEVIFNDVRVVNPLETNVEPEIMTQPENKSPPIVGKGSYAIDWDNFDESMNPFESRVRLGNSPTRCGKQSAPLGDGISSSKSIKPQEIAPGSPVKSSSSLGDCKKLKEAETGNAASAESETRTDVPLQGTASSVAAQSKALTKDPSRCVKSQLIISVFCKFRHFCNCCG